MISLWKGQFHLEIKHSPSLVLHSLKTHMHLKNYWKCSKRQCVELSSGVVHIYITAASPPADQQSIHRHQGGLSVHNYTYRSIVMTGGACTKHFTLEFTH